MWFDDVQPAPPDAILGLTEAFKIDSNPSKINLGVGVYKDENGATPVLASVKEAEGRLLGKESTKSYMPINGSAEYGAQVQRMILGDHAAVSEGRCFTMHTPGGTGALRTGAELLRILDQKGAVWVSRPTWANHKGIFSTAGFEIKEYGYYKAETKGLDFEQMKADLAAVPPGDIVLMHVCCHNPTGVDLSLEQWRQVAEIAAEKGWLPFLDFAYQGFGNSVEEDREPLRVMADNVPVFFVASSFSKNFGLYRERTGAFNAVFSSKERAAAVFSHAKLAVRRNYSNPPAHGGLIVEEILNDGALTAQWRAELDAMCTRIKSMRKLLVDKLAEKGVEGDFSFIKEQRGMFSFSGLTDAQVQFLREKKSIYIVKGGRINVAGITPANIEYLVDGIADTMAL